MTAVVRFPEQRGRWAWDARGDNRAARVSTHVRERVINLSVWRDDVCVGTVRLLPDDAAALVSGLTEGLAQLAARPVEVPAQVGDLEQRLARLESRFAEPALRATAARIARSVRAAVASRRLRPEQPS